MKESKTADFRYRGYGQSVFYTDPKNMIMLVRPKWWQFWRKARLVNVLDVIMDAKYETDKTMQSNFQHPPTMG